MDKTRLGVIGLGGIAQLIHLPILSKLDNAEVIAIAEVNKNRLKFVGEKFSIKKQYLNYADMLNFEELDAVIIATPTNTHAQIAVDCLKAKKHVLIEKPIAINHQEAKEINSAASRNKRIAMIGMNLRFRPDAMLLKSLVNSGELGEIFYVKCSWLRKQSSDQKWFLNKSLSGGGVIIDLGIVILDLALWIMGDEPIKTVSVQKFCHNTKEVEDSAVGFIKLNGEKVISFEVSWGLHSDSDTFKLTSYGTKGTAHLNPLRAYRRLESARIDYTPAQTTNTSNLFRKSYENELKHFIAVIRDNDFKLVSSSNDSLSRMKLLEAIYQSAESGKEVKV